MSGTVLLVISLSNRKAEYCKFSPKSSWITLYNRYFYSSFIFMIH